MLPNTKTQPSFAKQMTLLAPSHSNDWFWLPSAQAWVTVLVISIS